MMYLPPGGLWRRPSFSEGSFVHRVAIQEVRSGAFSTRRASPSVEDGESRHPVCCPKKRRRCNALGPTCFALRSGHHRADARTRPDPDLLEMLPLPRKGSVCCRGRGTTRPRTATEECLQSPQSVESRWLMLKDSTVVLTVAAKGRSCSRRWPQPLRNSTR